MASIEDDDFPSDLWPTNALVVMAEEIAEAMPEVDAIAYRRVEVDDPAITIGLYVQQWDATEFCIGQRYPEFAEYRYGLELMVRGVPRAMVVGIHAQLTKKLRAMLYQYDPLDVRLRALAETSFGVTERYSRLTIGRQSFESGATGNSFVAASTTTVIIRTENSS